MTAKPGETPELARRAMLYRTIPNTQDDISVGTSATYSATALAPYAGMVVFLVANGGDISILRGSDVSGAFAAGQGITISDGKYEELYVDPNGSFGLNHIGTASCTLHVLSDSEID